MEKYKFDAGSILKLQFAICEELEKYFKENPEADEVDLLDHICKEFKDRVDGTQHQLRVCTMDILIGYFSVCHTLGNPDEFTTQQRSEAQQRCPYFEAIDKAIRFSAYYRNQATGEEQQNPGSSLMNLLLAPSIIRAQRPTGAQPRQVPVQVLAPVRPQKIPWLVTPGVSESLINFMGDYYEQNPGASDKHMERAAVAYLKIRYQIYVGTADIASHLRQCEVEYHAVRSGIEINQHHPDFNREDYIAQYCPFFYVMRIALEKFENSRHWSQSGMVELRGDRSGALQAWSSSSQPFVSPSKEASGRKRAAPSATVTSSSEYWGPSTSCAAESASRSGGHESRRLSEVGVRGPPVIVEPIESTSIKRIKVPGDPQDEIAKGVNVFFRKYKLHRLSAEPQPPRVQPKEPVSEPKPPNVKPKDKDSEPS